MGKHFCNLFLLCVLISGSDSVNNVLTQTITGQRATVYTQAFQSLLKDERNSTKEEIKLGMRPIVSENEILEDDITEKGLNIVCYYKVPNMNDRPYPVFPEILDPFLCTHINVAFAVVLNSSVVPNDLNDVQFYNRTVHLKKKNPNLKILLSIGSVSSESSGAEFGNMVASSVNRAKFIKSVIWTLRTYNFDGVDLDWEFPAYPNHIEQKTQFIQLLKQLKSMMEANNYLLTIAVPAPKQLVDIGYDIPEIANYVDSINLMSYDFHTFSYINPLTGPNSPLHRNPDYEFGFMATLNTEWAANYWYQNGMPAEKINVGIPTYGRSYTLVSREQHGYYAVTKGVGSIGNSGYAPYPEICKFLETNGTRSVFEKHSNVPYAFNGLEWITFENEHSSNDKAAWVKQVKFGGVMFWCLNDDDAYKTCKTSTDTFPIVRSAALRLNKTIYKN